MVPYVCRKDVVVPPAYQISGYYEGVGCPAPYQDQACQFAVGNWTLASSSIFHFGPPVFSPMGTNLSLLPRTLSLMTLCVDSFSALPPTPEVPIHYNLMFESPDEQELLACAIFMVRASGLTTVWYGLSSRGEGNCTPADSDYSVNLPNLTWTPSLSDAVMSCPRTQVIPKAFVQPQVALFPPSPLDLYMPNTAGLSSASYDSTYLLRVVNQSVCALSFQLVEDNREDELTRWEVLFGPDASAPVGCMSFLRLGRHVAYAERFLDNSVMDESCGGPATAANLCCWNWTYGFNPGWSDGASVKVLFDYFPQGWTPDSAPGGSGSSSAGLSTAAAAAIGAVGVLGLLGLGLAARQLLLKWQAAGEAKYSGLPSSAEEGSAGRAQAWHKVFSASSGEVVDSEAGGSVQ